MLPFVIIFNFFGAFLAFLLGVGQLVQKGNRHKLLICALFFTLSFMIFYFSLVDSLWILKLPHLLFINIPFLYLLSPLLYIYISIITTQNFVLQKKHIIHFIPTIFSIAITIPFVIKDRDQKVLMIQNIIYKGDFSTANLLLIIPTIMILSYLMVLFWINNPFINYKDRKIIFINIILVIWALAALIGGYIFIQGNVHFVRYVIGFLNISLVIIFLINQYDPALMSHVTREIIRKKYENSHLNNVNLDNLDSSLMFLFQDKKIYRDSSLSLKKSSKKLNISAHQLSQYINEHKKTNFNGFINTFRIKEAAEILKETDEKNIVDIAFEVGFNSVSSFHEAFKKIYGMSPAEYRKSNS
jgi:AraC-like DNA-binding protein